MLRDGGAAFSEELLSAAAEAGQFHVAEYLLESDVSHTDKCVTLFTCVLANDVQALELRVKQDKEDSQQTWRRYLSAMAYAASLGRLSIVRVLLRSGVSFPQSAKDGLIARMSNSTTG